MRRGILSKLVDSASSHPPRSTLSQSSSLSGLVSVTPLRLMSITAASKIQSDVGSMMCSINSLTESVGASDESSVGAAGVATVDVADVGLDEQYWEASAQRNSTTAQPIIHPRLMR